MPTQDDGGRKYDDLWHGEPRTLRDYFAASALQGLLISKKAYWFTDNDKPTGVECAKLAYEVADAMLAERNKQDPTSPLWGEQHKET